MMTVTFPTGVRVRFNNANFVVRTQGYTDLYQQTENQAAAKENGSWQAQVPNSALIEAVTPCAVDIPQQVERHEVGRLATEVRTLKQTVARLERKLKPRS